MSRLLDPTETEPGLAGDGLPHTADLGAPSGQTHLGDQPAVVSDSRRARMALFVLLGATALAYLWDLSASGQANSFYAAAVQAGTKSWKAFFFGSLDSSNFITVDKPPGSLWVMEVFGRLFGFSSWSMLAPQALEGVATVGLVYAATRRWFGSGAGLIAGSVMASTPVAALMFRYNNPDALLVLLLVVSAYALIRALEAGATRWIALAGALLGFAFLAKMLQAFTVLPAFGLVYLVAAPPRLIRRIGQLLIGGLALVVAAGWWVAIVALWPAASRPFIDGSPDNSIINLIVGYNGLGRLSGSAGGGVTFSGAPGVGRLLNDVMAGQASWLLPATLAITLVVVVARGRARRTDRARAAAMLWGGWLVVTAAVFSFGRGVIHTYYTVALAPAIACLVGIGVSLAWSRRELLRARILVALTVEGTAIWSYVLLDRTSAYHPWLRVVVLVGASLGVVVMIIAPHIRFAASDGRGGTTLRRVGLGGAGVALLACLGGPAAFAASTVATPETGSIPSAGPSSGGSGGFGFGGGFGGFAGGSRGNAPNGASFGASGGAALGPPGGQSFASPPPGGFGGGGTPPAGLFGGGNRSGKGAVGGQGGTSSLGAPLRNALRANANAYRWVAATSGSMSAASLELGSGEPVMAIGGFSGQGGNLGLAAFEKYVHEGLIHYWIGSDGGGFGGGRSSASAISTWVSSHYRSTSIGGQSVYDLSLR